MDFLDLPPKTEAVKICCNVWRIKGTSRYYFGSWEIKLTIPLLYLFFSLSILIIYENDVKFPHSYSSNMPICIVVLFILSKLTTALVAIVGPGFLPYYEGGKEYLPIDFIDDNPASWVAIYKKQLRFALDNKPHERCLFVQSEGRFVLRASVYGLISCTTIGANNQKLYVLSLLYTAMYYMTIFYSSINSLAYEEFTYGIDARILRIALIIFLSLVLFAGFITSFFFEIRYAIFNITPLELADNNFRYTRSPMKNLSDVFGKWYLWLIPVPASFGR
jgi:hypothetical protein